MTTDHRAEAERWTKNLPQAQHVGLPLHEGHRASIASAHLLAALHDGQQEQTALLRDLSRAIVKAAEEYAAQAEGLLDKGDPCPCGCRRDVESKPRLNGSASHECKRGCGHDEPEVRAIRDASWDIPPLARDGAKPDPLPGLPEAADLLDALRGLGWDVTSRKPKSEPEPATVTLPRDVVEAASRNLRDAADLTRANAFPLIAVRFSRVADALDAAIDDGRLCCPQPRRDR